VLLSLLSIELGLSDKIETKQLDFLQAENMSPAYIKMVRLSYFHLLDYLLISQSPEATIPALKASDRVCRNTTDVIDYMVNVSPIRVARRTNMTSIVHGSHIDAKFMIFAAVSRMVTCCLASRSLILIGPNDRVQRDETELAVKSAGQPMVVLASRKYSLPHQT
jgi:hypothetical protein